MPLGNGEDTDVATNTNAEATFSEAIDSSSITEQAFTLSKVGSQVPAHVSYDSVTKKATLNPHSDLEANTIYAATITTSVKDTAGNALEQDYTWPFKTGPGSNPNSVTVTPATLNFSAVEVGELCTGATKYLTVTNNGPSDVTFAAVSTTGPDASSFFDGAKSYIEFIGAFTVQAGNHFSDEVTFIPWRDSLDDFSQSYSATLTYKDQNGATIGNPVPLDATTSCLVFG